MDGEMSYASELVREVRESYGLVLKQVAAATGYSTSAINRWEICADPPATYVARLFAMTHDARLVQLVCPGLTICQLDLVPQRTPPPGDPMALIAEELEAIEQAAKAAQYVSRIVGDGRVDESDDHALAKLSEAHNRVHDRLARVDAALAAWRQGINGRRHA